MTSSILSPPPYQQHASMHGYGAPPQQHAPQRAYIASTTSRYSIGAHPQNSAHSHQANPDEDWTKISDLAERRRIQNRIAQRNYRERKKIKRRQEQEDLERRALSTSPPPGSNAALVQQQQQQQHDLNGPKRRPSKPGAMPPKRSPSLNQGVFGQAAPDYAAGNTLYPSRRDSRQPSLTPPPSMTYSTSSATTSPSMPSVYQQQGAHPAPPPYSYGGYSDAAYPSMSQPILPPPVALGRMGEQEPWAQSKPYAGDEMFNQFGMGNQYPSSSAAPYENGVTNVSTGYPEQGIYSNPPMGY